MTHRIVLTLGMVIAGTLALTVTSCGGGKTEGVQTVTVKTSESYSMPSSSMEPTIHCAIPGPGCEASRADGLIAESVSPSDLRRGDIVLFETPPAAEARCGSGGTFVKRIIGLPGETVEIRVLSGVAYVYINGKRLDEPYIQQERRDIGPAETFNVPQGEYFMMGDNRAQSCDSRVWGSVPAQNISGRLTKIVRAG